MVGGGGSGERGAGLCADTPMDAAEAQLAGLRAALSAAEGGGAQIGAEALVAALRALRSSVAADTERCQRIVTERDAVAAQVQEMAAANAKLRYQIGHLQRAHEAPAPEPEAPAPEAKLPQADAAEGGGEMEAQPGDFAFYACVGVRVWVVPPDGAAGWGGVVTRGPDAELGVWHVRREVTNVGLDDGWPREEAVPHEWLRARRRFAPSGASRERLGRSYEWSAALPDPAPAPASASAPAPAPKRKKVRKVVSSSSSSSDEEPTEEEKVYWARAEAILAEYSLSKMAMAAAKMWIKEMGHPVKGKSLHRVQVWFLHRMQGRVRSPPSSTWQSGCPEIIPKLTARPWWSAEHLGWLSKLQAVRRHLSGAHTGLLSNLSPPAFGGRDWMMWCRSCVSCVARASSSHTERRAGPVVRRRRTVSGRLPPTAASGTCAPRSTLDSYSPAC